MSKQDEIKRDLEIEKLIQDLRNNKYNINIDFYKLMLLTVAVTTAIVTAYFKFQVGK